MKMNKNTSILLIILCISVVCIGHLGAQRCVPFQQKVNYTIEVVLDHNEHALSGKEYITYFNNSPDSLNQLFIHLYWNAFQPNSMMDVRSREQGEKIPFGYPDWDRRVKDRIWRLKEHEQGKVHLKSVFVNGQPQPIHIHETIAQIRLSTAILPKSIATIEIEFQSQVPQQIRRSGRNNAEGVMYSMSQWYPKICAYDKDGWHPNPYVSREFYGEWGDFDVSIQADTSLYLAGSGYRIKNWQTSLIPSKSKKIWSFHAHKVHDFVWAADKDFVEKQRTITDDINISVVYKKTTDQEAAAWEEILDLAYSIYPFMKKKFGAYIYKKYSFIQGGDGGMEYPTATLIKSPDKSTAIHEWMHSWYQMLLATNESLYPWMDEGFTSWASTQIEEFLHPSKKPLKYYNHYFKLVEKGIEEPLSTHADHYNTNVAYSIASYVKGAIFLEQLGYIVGSEVRDQILLAYYEKYKYRHPTPDDFIKVAEDVSGLQLDWYKEYWINSTRTIDYKIDTVNQRAPQKEEYQIILRRVGMMPMPIDLTITFQDKSKVTYTVPLDLMYGHKKESKDSSLISLTPWKWTHPTYTITLPQKVAKVEIDTSGRLADINKEDNTYTIKLIDE